MSLRKGLMNDEFQELYDDYRASSPRGMDEWNWDPEFDFYISMNKKNIFSQIGQENGVRPTSVNVD